MRVDLEEKVTRSILLIRHAIHRGQRLEVAISGGKDSDVLIELCKMADVWGKSGLRPLYRCTTIDPPRTIKHVLSQGVEMLRPKMSFRDCILRSGFPTMFARHCCGTLKEFAVEDYVVIGVRKSESVKRMKNYHEPEICKVYPNGGGKAVQYLPLLDWSDDDVREFIEERGIRCHPLYSIMTSRVISMWSVVLVVWVVPLPITRKELMSSENTQRWCVFGVVQVSSISIPILM